MYGFMIYAIRLHRFWSTVDVPCMRGRRFFGHSQVKTNQRYAHLSQDSLVSAANEVSKAIPLNAMLPNSVGPVPLVGIQPVG